MAKAISMVVEGEMERPVWLVFLLSSLLDVISFGLSLGAQSRRNKVKKPRSSDFGAICSSLPLFCL
jgi:hypothetical protein